MNLSFSRIPLVATALVLSLGLAGCAGTAGAAGTADAAPTTNASDTSSAQKAGALTMSDAWAKAATIGDMTAAFGTLTNDGDTDLSIVSADVQLAGTDAASAIELHETVMDGSGAMTMREVDGGFTVPAHGSLTLEPGGNHIMLMGLAADLVAGDEVSVTLNLSDGSAITVDAPVKDFTGANENYGGDMDHGDMDHGDHTDHTMDPTP